MTELEQRVLKRIEELEPINHTVRGIAELLEQENIWDSGRVARLIYRGHNPGAPFELFPQQWPRILERVNQKLSESVDANVPRPPRDETKAIISPVDREVILYTGALEYFICLEPHCFQLAKGFIGIAIPIRKENVLKIEVTYRLCQKVSSQA